MNRRMCFLDEEVSVILGGGRNKSLKTQQKTQQKTRSKTKRKRWMQKQIWMKKKPQSILKQTKMNGTPSLWLLCGERMWNFKPFLLREICFECSPKQCWNRLQEEVDFSAELFFFFLFFKNFLHECKFVLFNWWLMESIVICIKCWCKDSSLPKWTRNVKSGKASTVAQCVKVCITKLDDLSLSPWIHMVEEKDWL